MSTQPIPITDGSYVAHIESTADTCGGKPRIAGSRIRVQDVVVWHERMGLSADEIVSRFPHLSLADVYAALAYYHDHREQIESDMMRGSELVEELQQLFPSKLAAKRSVNS
jgi:uncharacterized protein (DUF433 family)